jgi:Leucine-rich repeat (LRR) protein
MSEFRVNDYIVLKLENRKTEIYILGERFVQCKFLLIDIPVEEISTLDKIKSIDEAAENLDNSLEGSYIQKYNIDRKTEFWAHCSNLQVWAEQEYDTRLLHRNLAFPLLKRLTKAGDRVAKKVFKEEIAKRMEEGNFSVSLYFLEEKYLDFLTKEEQKAVFLDLNIKLKENIEQVLKREETSRVVNKFISEELVKLYEKVEHQKLGEGFRQDIINRLEEGNQEEALSLLDHKHFDLIHEDGRYWKMIDKKKIEHSLYDEFEQSRETIRKLLKKDDSLRKVALLILKELAELGDMIAKEMSITEFEKHFRRNAKKINISPEEFLLKESEGISPEPSYYLYLDRNTMLNMLLEENEVEVILELDEIIMNQWIAFKSSLRGDEEEQYPEVFRREKLVLNPILYSWGWGDPDEEWEESPYHFFIKNRQIVAINLSRVKDFRLWSFPEPILKLKALQKLDLGGNRLEKIPEAISNLKGLQELNLDGCSIKNLPASITKLKYLKKLNLSLNRLESLPESIGKLTSLEELNLNNNNIKGLPLSFSALNSLKTLKFNKNKLSILPQEIYDVKSLGSLLINQNGLTALSGKIKNLDSLTHIDIAFNKLDRLPESILNMDNLQVIYIDKSQKELYPFKELKQIKDKEKKKRVRVSI